jgi:hypothetical protein
LNLEARWAAAPPFATGKHRPRRRTANLAQFSGFRSLPVYIVSTVKNHQEIHMKTIHGFAALSLSLILGLVPFALIAVDDFVVAKAEVSTTGLKPNLFRRSTPPKIR